MNRYPWSLLIVLLVSGLLLTGWLGLCEISAESSSLKTIRYVAANGDCGTNTPCYAELQAAVDAANGGDEVRVAAGRYTGVSDRNGTTQLVYLDKSITIRGGYHPQTWAPDPTINPTILDAQGLGRVLFVIGDVSPTVDGFHLINGSAVEGGGVYVDTSAISLVRNEIYGNWAEGRGGGVSLKNSAANIVGNHIYSNTTGDSGRGGGLALTDSATSVNDNIFENNRAHAGGAIVMNNTLGEGGALLTGNTIRNNLAFDVERDGRTFDGAGGGIDLSSYLTDTLRDNVISGNIAKWGGGVHAFDATAIIEDNRIQQNNAPIHGGGLYAQGGQITLENNKILSNTADSWGGGLMLKVNVSLMRHNTVQGNRSGWRGGGMYSEGNTQFDGNLFLGNTAAEQGGGVFLYRGNNAIYQNSVIVGNHAKEGGGVYIWAANVSLVHSTIANNTSDDDRAVVIDKYPGLVNPGAPTLYTATVVFSSTIMAGEPVGFFATADNSLTVDGILWHDTPTHFQADGADLTALNERSGDPAFEADGYHVRSYSAARGQVASSLDHDVDGQLRDCCGDRYLGVDEYVPTTVVEPKTGGILTYTLPQDTGSISVFMPPDAITKAIGLRFSPFPPLPPGVMNSPFGRFVAVGPPFRLDPFFLKPSVPITDPANPPLGDPSPPLTFGLPAQVTLNGDLDKLRKLAGGLDQFVLRLFGPKKIPAPPQDPACKPVNPDLGSSMLATRITKVPICNTGIVSTTESATIPSVRLLAVDPENESGYFMFVVEVQESKVYLPMIAR